ncbi:hypothetical protein LEMLEM_LOCUS27087 [Lemmus lemmus]
MTHGNELLNVKMDGLKVPRRSQRGEWKSRKRRAKCPSFRALSPQTLVLWTPV